MKVLIAYDGSRSSEAALDDLVRAGLPEACEALAVSVAEAWLPSPNGDGNASGKALDPQAEVAPQKGTKKEDKVRGGASILSKHAEQRLQRTFPDWIIDSDSTYGSPGWEILSRANVFQPDLIVVGSHGRSALSRFFLGSISQKVLTEARCSVRVSRGRIEVDPVPVRLIVGFDGSRGAQTAVEAVAARPWREFSEIRLVAATEDSTPSTIGRFIRPIDRKKEVKESEREWIEKLADGALAKLNSSTISATLQIRAGNPKDILVEEAERWHADCIFVGANAAGSRLEHFLLGSTSAAVAARAHCSVEVARA